MKHILCLLSISTLLVGCSTGPYTYNEKSIDLEPNTVIIPKGYEVVEFPDYGNSITIKDPNKPNEYVQWNYMTDQRTVFVYMK